MRRHTALSSAQSVHTLVLASASPRRRELLERAGLDFRVEVSDVDESWTPGEHPVAYVRRVAASKAHAIADRLGCPADTVVLSADTTVDLDGVILAKPVDDDDAWTMLRSLSGRSHQVHTAVAGWSSTREHELVVTTDVVFIDLADDEIDWYLSTGEHRDKAGGYGMQGAAAAFVGRIDGSPSNVIGLPLAETVALLRSLGFARPTP